ncbi:uncharacterized protein LOC142178500 [Nicotiana tabacum]|uniref:Uncharacterized protein LOC142178500 n=1 Tax=Nicotiana tabacum TaxID=4097 RepID=A0AC58U4F9_TOBAC
MADDEIGNLSHNHPLFLKDSDGPGTALILLKLTGPENYALWSRLMQVALLVKNKLDFVDGTCLKSSFRGDLATRIKDLCGSPNKTKAIAILMELNESYSHVRRDVLLKRPVLNVNQAYSIVMQEESQRKFGVVEVNRDLLTMLVRKAQAFKNKRPGLICDYCGYKGYLKENCYKIIGYPPDFKKDQYKQLVNMLTISSAGDNTSSSDGSANLAERIKEIDKGSNDGVQIPTDSRSEITYTRDAIVMETQRITNVLHVPDFKFNLLSVSKLTKELCCSACFYPDFVVFQGLFNGKNQFETSIKVLRSDNGTEFYNAKYCVKTADYTINKLPTRVLKGKSPYEVLYGKPSKIDHLRLFECLCYTSTLPKGDKFPPRARRTVLIGYLETQKGYRLFDLDSKTFLVSRDVSFREKTFLFKQSGEPPKDLFLLSPINHTECTVQPTQHVHEGQSLQEESDTVPSEELAQVEEEDTDTTVGDNSYATTADKIGHDLDAGMDNEASLELESEMENGASSAEVPMHKELHEQPVTSLESVVARRSTRGFKPPIWHKDYVTSWTPSKGLTHSITNNVQYEHLPAHYQSSLTEFSNNIEPSSFKEASQDDRWVDAMKQEIHALEENNTWEIVDFPSRKKPIGSKWVHKIKYKANGEIDRFKARLVAKGYTQQESLDYHETLFPIAKMVRVRTIISLVASEGWNLYQMDVNNAFIFKQASRQWNIKLSNALLNAGYSQSAYNHSMFTKRGDGRHIVIILVYVDDILITGSNNDLPTQHVHEGQSLQEESDTVPSEELAQVEEEDTDTTAGDNCHATTGDNIGHDLDAGVKNEASLKLELEMENGASSAEHLPAHYQSYLTEFSNNIEPSSFREASQDDRWVDVMKQEIHAFEENNIWEIVDLPSRKKPIGSKWVYKINYKANGEIDRFKARLVAKDYTQQKALDYHETFSLVAKMVIIRTVINLAASEGWNIYQMDANNAFLQGDLI